MPDQGAVAGLPVVEVLAVLLEELPVGVAVLDADLRYRYVNPRLAALNRLPPERHLGHRPDELLAHLPPAAVAAMRRAQGQRLDGDELTGDVRGETPAPGSPVPVRVWDATYHPVPGPDGRTWVVAIVDEVTGEVESERRAQRSMRQLELALAAADMGSWDWDLASGTLRWDERTLELFGVSPEQFDGRAETFFSRVHPDDLAELLAAIDTAIATNGSYNPEFRVLRDGRVRWLQAWGRVLPNSAGEPGRLLGVVTDVTEVRTAREQVAWTLEHMTDGFVALDGQWRITYLNAAAERLLRRRREELVGRVLWEEFPEAVGSVFDERYREARETGQPVEFEALYEPLGLWIEARAFPSPDGLSVYLRDVTERKLGEAQREALLEAEQRARREAEEAQARVADALQRAVLPEALAARYVAATAGASVGGDWYDAFPVPGGRLAVVVGDVAGHGLRAASLMGQLRNALRAYAVDGHGPAATLRRLDTLLALLEPEAMATVVHVELDPVSGALRWANAGHPPPLLVTDTTDTTDTTAAVAWLDSPVDPVLGCGAPTVYTERRAVLAPGASLLLYTDGLIERREAALGCGLERLRAAAETAAGSSGGCPDELCARVLAAMLGDVGAPDDVCLLALRRCCSSVPSLHGLGDSPAF